MARVHRHCSAARPSAAHFMGLRGPCRAAPGCLASPACGSRLQRARAPRPWVCAARAAVLAAVTFLGESFSVVNGVGLGVLIAGVALFNWTKYQKMASGQAKGATRLPPAKDKH